jgi:hypothetical protein
VIKDIRNSRHDQRDHLRGRHDDRRNPLQETQKPRKITR